MTDPTADRIREILRHDPDEADAFESLANELDTHHRLRAERTGAAADPADALDRIAWELDRSYDLDGAADGPSAEGQELRQIAAHVRELSDRYRAEAHAARLETERAVDDLAIRVLETVLEVEALGRAAHHLLDSTIDEDDRPIVARDRITVDTIRRAVTAIDELGRYAHLTRKRAALGPLRDDPDARIRSLESVLRRVLVMVDAADGRLRTAAETGDPEELHEILSRTINLAAAAAPGPVTLRGPDTAYREIPSVVELDEAARHLDTILGLRFAPADGWTFPDEIRDEIRGTRTAAMHAATALARLGANVHPADGPATWEHLDDLAAMLDRALDPDHGMARDNSLVGPILERARYLVEQAGADPTRWTTSHDTDPDTASSPHE